MPTQTVQTEIAFVAHRGKEKSYCTNYVHLKIWQEKKHGGVAIQCIDVIFRVNKVY